MKVTKKQIEDIVFRYGLDEATRNRRIAYKRFYLSHLSKHHFPELNLTEAAFLVGYDKHCEVIYGRKRHLELRNNLQYKKYIKPLVIELKYGGSCFGQTLVGEVLKAETTEQLTIIKEKINDGVF